MINPVIVDRSESSQDDWEGCFSVPGLMGLVPRSETITVQYHSTDGKRVTVQYTGYLARVVQHEVDHLDGVEFVDRMTSLQSLTTVHNYLQYQRGTSGKASA